VSRPVRWLDFSTDGSVLLLASDAWLHALAATSPALEPMHSRLAPRRVWQGALAAGRGSQVRLLGWDDRGALGVVALDLATLPEADAALAHRSPSATGLPRSPCDSTTTGSRRRSTPNASAAACASTIFRRMCELSGGFGRRRRGIVPIVLRNLLGST
jgi:hypothetical protein